MARQYSGVPNAGAPDFMSTFEVKEPYATGAPGRTNCSSTIAARHSAVCWRSPGERYRRHRPGEGERRDDDQLVLSRKAHGAIQHGPIVLERGRRIDVGKHPWRFGKTGFIQAGGDAYHRHGVLNTLYAE